jgi:hypothetical protein
VLEYFEDVAVRSARTSHMIPAVCRVRFYVKVSSVRQNYEQEAGVQQQRCPDCSICPAAASTHVMLATNAACSGTGRGHGFRCRDATSCSGTASAASTCPLLPHCAVVIANSSSVVVLV